MLLLGLTGSIGMGKSATAAMFAAEGAPVFEADRTVHHLYANADIVALIEAAFPGTSTDGQVDRERLAKMVLNDRLAIARLEALVHPLVRRERENFLVTAVQAGARVAVLDIPLLFETKGETQVDATVVVSAPAEVQRARVLSRPNMTAAKLDAILAKQMPDPEKRRRAHFIVDTGRGFDSARAQVRGILRATTVILGRHAW